MNLKQELIKYQDWLSKSTLNIGTFVVGSDKLVEQYLDEFDSEHQEQQLNTPAVSDMLPFEEQLAKEIGEMSDEEFADNCRKLKGNER